VTLRALQFFFLAAILFSGARLYGDLSVGTTYSLSFVTIDGNKLSTSDGHVTVLVLTTPVERAKASTVADRVPERVLGNPDYRMITVVCFARGRTIFGRKLVTALLRHRVNEEAARLQSRYKSKGIERDARKDVLVATDFDGSVSSQLGQSTTDTGFAVFVFGRNGELIAQWHDVPSAEQLGAAIK
jgi:hypothetical protein